MKQYFEIKKDFQDSLLLFQVGDFYELFFDDAKKASSFLAIALTKRGNVNGEPIPLCGVPVHAIDHYLYKLVKGGFKIAICSQLEEPIPGKVVKRGITQVLTPGTLTDLKLLDSKSPSYLFSIFPDENKWGLLFGELLTAQLFATFIPAQSYKILESELTRFFPDEIILPDNKNSKQLDLYFKQQGYYSTIQNQNMNDSDFQNWLKKQFNQETLKTILENEVLKLAVLNFYFYLKKNQESALGQFNKVKFYKPEDFLMIDSATQKNLEIVKNNQDGSTKNSLFEAVDKSVTCMGSRLIKKWLLRPLININEIQQRQNAIEFSLKNIVFKEKLINSLSDVGDLERIVGKIALKRAQINDYLHLKKSLKIIPEIKNILKIYYEINLFFKIKNNLSDFEELKNLLERSLNDDSSTNYLIKKNFDANLDKLRDLAENAGRKILELETKEQNLTGISSLKIRYNQVQGYYIEVTKTNVDSVPSHYIRHQTLAGKERYLTPELQQLQFEIENAKNEAKSIEQNIFEQIKNEVNNDISSLRKTANSLANLDALIGFANFAYENAYVKPIFNNVGDIIIQEGKHPIIEKIIGKNFVSNSTNLTKDESLWIITGPNMGGKSTYLRQVALICILAQCGSFVPAKSANLPILDRIFSRIGAGDNLAEGKSTFFVEMEESATICQQATEKSLVILDEVGRGTSTYDGLAIAQSIVEHIVLNIKAKCLFATHYHELTSLENKFPNVVAYYAASQKNENGILFLHKIKKGIGNQSFGIEVAKNAKLPVNIIQRAEIILKELNNSTNNPFNNEIQIKNLNDIILNLENQLMSKEKIIFLIKGLDLNEISPKQALDILWEIKSQCNS